MISLTIRIGSNEFTVSGVDLAGLKEVGPYVKLWFEALAQANPAQLEQITQQLATLNGKVDTTMALTQAVTDKVNEIKATLAAGVAGIRGDIEELKAKVASGATEAEILAELDKISTSVADVTSLDAENPAATV